MSGVRSRSVAALVCVGLAVAGGVAYATIPDAGGVFTACRNAAGGIRLIDPSSPSALLSHCTSFETQIVWNRHGPQGPKGETGAVGPAGVTGPKGETGSAGVRGPQGAPGPTGDAGPQGSKGEKGPQGATGDRGPDGQQGGSAFSGHYASPNGLFTLDVTDSGITLAGPGGTATLGAASLTISSVGPLTLVGNSIGLNGCSRAVAHVGQEVSGSVTLDPFSGTIVGGTGTLIGAGAFSVCTG